MRAAGAPTACIVLLAACSPNVLVGIDSCSPGAVECSGLVHRYSFDGVGATVLDSIGAAHGSVVNAALTGQGSLTLVGAMGGEAQYVVLPHGLLRELHDATFEAWVNWAGSAAHDGTRTAWQRIFDFGEGTSGIEGEQASGGDARSYLFLTPETARKAGDLALKGAKAGNMNGFRIELGARTVAEALMIAKQRGLAR